MGGRERGSVGDVVEWIELAREGNRAAQSALYAYCEPRLTALVMDAVRLGSRRRTEPEELALRVFLETMHSIENHPPRIDEEQFLAHLHRVAGIRIRDELEGRGPLAASTRPACPTDRTERELAAGRLDPDS